MILSFWSVSFVWSVVCGSVVCGLSFMGYVSLSFVCVVYGVCRLCDKSLMWSVVCGVSFVGLSFVRLHHISTIKEFIDCSVTL